MPRYRNKTLCSISQNNRVKPCGFIKGIHVLPLNLTEKFHKLSSRHLNVTSSQVQYLTLAAFQKEGHFGFK